MTAISLKGPTVKIQDLKARRAVLATEMRAMLDAPGGEGGNLSAEQSQQFDAKKAEATGLEERIARQETVEEMERRATGTPIGSSGDGNLDRELRSFSLVRAVAAQVPGLDVDAGRERELSAEIARRAGRPFQGIAIPMSIFQQPLEQRVGTTTTPGGGPGSNLIQTTLDGGQYIDLLRAAMAVRGLGARILSGLVGNLEIPRMKAGSTAGWVAENGALSFSDVQHDKVSLTPKHAGCITEFSRNMLMQPSVDVEQLMRRDFATVLAATLDLAAIAGTGSSNQPTGILATSGIGNIAMGTNGAALTFDAVADLQGQVADVNAEMGSTAFLTNTKVRRAAAKLKDSQNRPLGIDTIFQGMPRAFSNGVPSNLTKGTATAICSALIYGNWSDLLIGLWSELDLLVNPYETTAYSKGNVQIRGMMTVDISVRHPESFAAIKDILA